MKKHLSTWLVPVFFILWVFFVIGSFFAVQKPFSAANVLAVGRVLLDVIVAGWVVLVGLGLGTWILSRFFALDLSSLETLVFGTGLGLGILSLFVLGLGLLGLFYSVVAYGVMLVLSITLTPPLWRLFRRLNPWPPANLPHRLTIIFLALMGVFALLLALLPPADWDGLFYHLTGPKLHLQAGRIVSGFDVPHFNFPSLMEMLFAWTMLLGSDIAAKLIHFGFGLLLGGLVYVVTRRLFGTKAAWPAVVILVSMPMLGMLAGWAYNDLALTFYQFAGLYAVSNWLLVKSNWGEADEEEQWVKETTKRESLQNPKPVLSGAQGAQAEGSKIQNRSWLVLSGLCAGLAMGLKYTSFVTPVIVVLLIVWFGLRHKHLKQATISVVLFSLIALSVAFPWYIKNWVFTGNPVYPFLSGVFDGQYWDSFRAEWYASAGTGIGWHPTTLLALPWLLTLGVRDINFWDGRTGPLLLLFLPLVVWGAFSRRYSDRPAAYNVLLMYTLAHFLFWTMGVIWSRSLWQSRLLLPGLVGLVPAAGWIWANLSRFDLPRFSLSRFVNIAVSITLILIVIDVGLLTLQFNPLPYIFGMETHRDHLTRRLGAHYATMEQINQELPAQAKIAFLWEPRSYYCNRDCRPDSILDEFPHLVYQYGSAEAIARQWRNAGVSHVLIHRTGLNFMLNESPEKINRTVLSNLENNYLDELFDVVGAYQVYSLKPAP